MLLSFSSFYSHYQDDVPKEVYESLCHNDISECVITALDFIRTTNKFIPFLRNHKSASRAFQLIDHGRDAFSIDNYQKALGYFNCALSFAPPNTDVMALVYLNRAKLFLSTKQLSSCLKDVKTCLEFNCPVPIVDQLKDIEKLASNDLKVEQANQKYRGLSAYEENFFELKNRNSTVPCTTSDIEVTMEAQGLKVVAAKNIPVGTILVLEKPYVSSASNGSVFLCHYCQKMSLNLIPCPGCCVALFCDTKCQENSTKEGHNIECKIIELTLTGGYQTALPLKAILKMRQSSGSWKDIINASCELGVERMKNSKIEDIGSGISLLSSEIDKHFIYGEMFNVCMFHANLIHYLDIHTSFFPNSSDDNKDAAIRATSRIMMHLILNSATIGIPNCMNVRTKQIIQSYGYPHFGYFPFIGKLKHSCLPNSLAIGMNNTLVLVASMPIKQGDVLTTSHLDDWYTNRPDVTGRQRKMFFAMKTVCNCVICTTDEKPISEKLNNSENHQYMTWIFMHLNMCNNLKKNLETLFKEVCKTMEALRNVPYSQEFRSAYLYFVAYIWQFVDLKSSNVALSEITDEILSSLNREILLYL